MRPQGSGVSALTIPAVASEAVHSRSMEPGQTTLASVEGYGQTPAGLLMQATAAEQISLNILPVVQKLNAGEIRLFVLGVKYYGS